MKHFFLLRLSTIIRKTTSLRRFSHNNVDDMSGSKSIKASFNICDDTRRDIQYEYEVCIVIKTVGTPKQIVILPCMHFLQRQSVKTLFIAYMISRHG